MPHSTPSDIDRFTPPLAYLSGVREDGYSDGYGNTFQGVRAYDGNVGQWTSPDAYAGDVHDPMTQKPFMWNRNNPLEYEDPTGYDWATMFARPTSIPGEDHIFIEITRDDGTKERVSFGPTYEGLSILIHGMGSLDRQGQGYDAKFSGGANGATSARLGNCSHTCYHAIHAEANAINNAHNTYSLDSVNSNAAGHAVCSAGFGGATCASAHKKLKRSTPGFNSKVRTKPN